MTDLPLVARFNLKRWTPTRHKIHDMQLGDSITFPPGEYFNAKSSVSRLNEAYDGTRVWLIKISGDIATATRTL